MKTTLLTIALLLACCSPIFGEHARVLFLCGEEQYGTEEALREFAKGPLKEAGYKSVFVTAASGELKDEKRNVFPGLLQELPKSDLLVVATWRRFPAEAEMALLKKWVADGKPVLGLRTASHAFSARKGWKVPEGHAAWESFDRDVFGASYDNHYRKVAEAKKQATIRRTEKSDDFSVLHQLSSDTSLAVATVLYRMKDLDEKAQLLLQGSPAHEEGVQQPVAWSFAKNGRKSFYTSLGAQSDFEELPWLEGLLLNAIKWSLEQ